MEKDAEAAQSRMMTALNRLAKWRTIFAGWQLGTRLDTDPECQAVRDHWDATLVLRVEMTALTALLLSKGVFTMDELANQTATEADAMNDALSARFPGARATDTGMTIDLVKAREWMAGWRL